MNYFHALFLVVTVLLLTGCSSSESDADASIHPSQLPEWSFEPKFSIGESDDWMPGVIQNLVVLPNGHMVVLDRASTELHQFDADGNWLQRIAGPGSGPGELQQWTRVGLSNNGIRTTGQEGTIQLFEPDDNGLLRFERDLKIDIRDRRSTLMGRLGPEINLMANNEQLRVNDRDNPDQVFPEYRENLVFLADDDGNILKDSLLTRQQHNGLMLLGDGSIRLFSLPYRYSDVISINTDQTFIFGDVETGQITLFDNEGTIIHEIEAQFAERDVAPEVLEAYLEAIPREEHDRAQGRIRDQRPPFEHIILDDEQRFWLRTDRNQDGDVYVVLSYTGEPLGRIKVPADNDLRAVRNGLIYTSYTPDDDLHEVQIFRLTD